METWGVAPGSKLNAAPLALNTNETSSTRRAHLLSKGKITFQSFFILMTVQPFFFASAISASLNVPILIPRRKRNSGIRVIREPNCGNSETEGKAATGCGERARVASEFQIRG